MLVPQSREGRARTWERLGRRDGVFSGVGGRRRVNSRGRRDDVRVCNRDAIDGRPRGVLSKYGISRVRFRDMAHRGELPGVTKSSW